MFHDDVSHPLVSISCITYNHANYIKQCLDGFLLQETQFPYEVLIHDDASTDGTEEIIREYHAKYPAIIKPLYEKKNQWVEGRRGSVAFNFPRAKGKYIAMCEGDDYWVDPCKLQKQVDYLESNDIAAGCFTDCRILNENGNEIEKAIVFPQKYRESHSQHMCLTELSSGYGTATLVFRSSVIAKGLPRYYLSSVSDYLLDIAITEHGTLDYLPELTSVYRLQAGGIWQGESPIQNCLKKILRLNALGQSPHMMSRYARDLEHMWLNEMCIYGEQSASEKASISDAIESIENLNNELRDSPFRHLVKKCGVKYLVRNWNNLGASGKTLTQRLAWLIDATVRSPRLAPACCRFLFKLMEVRFKHAKL